MSAIESQKRLCNFSAIICALVGILIFWEATEADFAYDDIRAIIQNEDIVSHETKLSQIFTHDFWGTSLSHSGSHKSFRPLVSLSFKLNFMLSGYHAFSYHLTNIVLHGVVTALFVKLTFHLIGNIALSSLAGLLFAVHPVHVEAVAGLVGRADLLSAAFFLLAILSYIYHRKNGCQKYLLFTIVFSSCAMLCKEQGITALAVCLALELIGGIKKTKKLNESQEFGLGSKERGLILVSSAMCILSYRLYLIGFSPPTFAQADNPAAKNHSWFQRTFTLLFLPVFNAELLFKPSVLSFDYSMEAIPQIRQVLDSRIVGIFLFYTTLVSLGMCHLGRAIKMSLSGKCSSFAISLIILSFIPASNLLFYVGFVVAERILYIPSLGFCLLSANAMLTVFATRKKVGKYVIATCIVMVILGGSFKTMSRTTDWKQEEYLYQAGISINPAKAYGNLGNIYAQQGQHHIAEQAYVLSLHFRSNSADVHYNLGLLYQQQNFLSKAASCYRNAIKFRPKLIMAYVNMAQVLATLGLKSEALLINHKLLEITNDGVMDPQQHAFGKILALMNMGKIYLEHGDSKKATLLLERAQKSPEAHLATFNQLQNVLNLLGEAYQQMNESSRAEELFKTSIKVKPGEITTHLKYAKLLAKNKTRLGDATTQFLTAKKLAPRNPDISFHYGLFLLDEGGQANLLLAAENFVLASIELNEGDSLYYESLFNAAVAYREAGELLKAELFYGKAAKVKPNDASARLNYGAILHLVEKYKLAEEEYYRAWTLKPNDAIIKTNIKRLQRSMLKKGLKVNDFVTV